MPSAARCSGVSRWWVVVAGWVTRLLASPRLFEISTISSASRKRKAAALPPASSSASIVPPVSICRAESAACGWSGSPG